MEIHDVNFNYILADGRDLMVGLDEESQLIQTGHGLDDHDYSVVEYPSAVTAIEEQMLAFEEGFGM